MVDPTLIAFSNTTAPIVIKSVVEANWTQYSLSLISLLITSFGIFLIFLIPQGGFSAIIAKMKLKSLTGRPTLVIKHNETSLFSVAMIDQKTLNRVSKFLNKHRNKAVNIVLHTPGGSVFHSQAISHIIKEHDQGVHLYVPVMAMSGGTLLAMSASHLYLTNTASLGPVDPQLGLLWTFGSADSWKKVIKKKGKLARDESIGLHNEGQKYTKEIHDHFLSIGVRKDVASLLTNGKLPHGHRFTIGTVTLMRPRVYNMSEEERSLTTRIVV